ncbi:MAG: glycosyl hydrolase family 18 protein, partial [Mucilaginibacter sp.]
MPNKQVFQADTPNRWNRFKWLSRALILLLVISVIGAVITITSRQYPSLPNLNPSPKKLSKEELDRLKRSTKYKDYKVQKSKIVALAKSKRLHQLKHPNNKNRINAGFYKAWESQAFNSLADHINKLDMIVSEGFFIKPGADTIMNKIDTGLIHLNKKYKKPVIVSVSNYVNVDNVSGYFDTKNVYRIIKSKKLRTIFINSLVANLKRYGFKGINLDFDDINNRNAADYITFERELYATLHPLGYLVTQNVMPDDDQYNLELLQKYNDYLFVMAIDQHTEQSNAGDISNQHWVEELLDKVCSRIPSEKVILTIAGGGVDWPENSIGKQVGYQTVISTANENKSKIIFDPVSANLHYIYYDLDSLLHTVYFTDAATNFNIIRMADDWDTGGVALWR